MILNALQGKPLPVYGNGDQIRDWLYVKDHARALYEVVKTVQRYLDNLEWCRRVQDGTYQRERLGVSA